MIFEKNDKYDLFAMLPLYIFTAFCIAIGISISAHLSLIHAPFYKLAILAVLMSLMGPIVDISRYSE